MKQPIILVILAAVALFWQTSCKKDPIEQMPPPQQQLPNPLPANALVKQLKWTDTDHQTFEYNAQNQVSKIRSQYQYVEGDPTKISTITYDFQHDSQHRPIQLMVTGGLHSRYFYDGNRIIKTQELYQNGTVSKEVTYSYANGRVTEELWRVPNYVPGESDDFYKHVFSYDAKGNLNRVEIYEQVANLPYQLHETTVYSDFDDKINPTSWMMRYPFVPQMWYQFNNPRKEVRVQAGGSTDTITYAYEYNAHGLPVSKVTTYLHGTLVVHYQY